MPPKRKTPAGLQRVGCEWVNYSLSFAALPEDWSAMEAAKNPAPWLDDSSHLHALRRLAIMADAPAARLLLSLRGSDREKEGQLRALVAQGSDKAAVATTRAVAVARAYLAENPPAPMPPTRSCPEDPASSGGEDL
eukprot:4340579-Alexandrium_andersonii.AAC.1